MHEVMKEEKREADQTRGQSKEAVARVEGLVNDTRAKMRLRLKQEAELSGEFRAYTSRTVQG